MQESLDYIKQAFELKSQQCYKQAIEMLYRALEIEGDNCEILFQLGELYFLLKNFARAEQYFEKVLSKNENHIESLKIMKKIYFSSDLKKASDTAQKIYNLQKNSENLISLIEISSKRGELQKIKEFENSDDDKVLYAIAKTYYDNKKYNDCEQQLEKALEINPENEDALVLLGKIYFDKNEFEKSRKIFEKFSITSENPEALNYLGLFAIGDLKFTEAIKYFSKAYNLNKKNAKYSYNLGNAYFYNGWIKEAAAAYLQAIRLEPENNGFRYSLAYLYYETKNFDKAQNEIDYILEQNTDFAPAHVLNALLKYERKDFLGAKLELETLKSDDNFTLVSLAKVYTELLMFDKAENLIQKVISQNPDSLNYKCQLADIYTAGKKYENALKIIDEIIFANENYIKAYITGAKAAFEMKDIERTKDFAQGAISLDMNFAGGYYYLALVRFEEKDYDEAIECMKRAIVYDIDNAQYYAKMSEIYEAKQDYKNALEYIKEAENISSEFGIAFQRLAALNRKI